MKFSPVLRSIKRNLLVSDLQREIERCYRDSYNVYTNATHFRFVYRVVMNVQIYLKRSHVIFALHLGTGIVNASLLFSWENILHKPVIAHVLQSTNIINRL